MESIKSHSKPSAKDMAEVLKASASINDLLKLECPTISAILDKCAPSLTMTAQVSSGSIQQIENRLGCSQSDTRNNPRAHQEIDRDRESCGTGSPSSAIGAQDNKSSSHNSLREASRMTGIFDRMDSRSLKTAAYLASLHHLIREQIELVSLELDQAVSTARSSQKPAGPGSRVNEYRETGA